MTQVSPQAFCVYMYSLKSNWNAVNLFANEKIHLSFLDYAFTLLL